MKAIGFITILLVITFLANCQADQPKQKCTKITHSSCQSVGYDNTALFPDVNGKPYQETIGNELAIYLYQLSSCSKETSTAVLCSLYFPKCVEHLTRPILPCRSVCNEFVHKCGAALHKVAFQGMFAGMCELLPIYDGNSETCFIPNGFNVSLSEKGVNKTKCHKVGITNCQDDLHYNSTFVATETQNKSSDHILQKIIATNCSSNIEKYTCFARFPPCSTGVVQIPCKSLCTEINTSCKKQFQSYLIPPSDCNFLYPDKVGVNGLCNLTTWPAPWYSGPWPTTQPPTKPSTTAAPHGCEKCDKIKIQECADAGYSYTFKFHDIDGQSYQNHTASAQGKFIDLLKTCSKYTKTILCSMYLPKCDVTTCSRLPVLPCRPVCYEFVRNCEAYLIKAALHGLMVGLCDLLPLNSTARTPCFVPPGFKPTVDVYQRHVCYPLSNQHNRCTKDFSYNTTFITPQQQVIAKDHLLQPVVDSKCSPQVEKFFCYTRFPPCGKKGHMSVALPCRSMCVEVTSKCKGVFTKYGLPIADCNFLLPDVSGEGDICQADAFPIPFRHIKDRPPTSNPNPERKRSKAGLIVGITLLVVVIVVVAVIVVLYYRKKKSQSPFQPQELHNVDNNEKAFS